jgi:lipopolysaccharide/colanic/teichoic acid biosynthesis glycosyltransferase
MEKENKNEEYIISPNSGRLKRRKKIRIKKKKSRFTWKNLVAVLFHPITVLLMLAALAGVIYLKMPGSTAPKQKKVATDDKTKNINKLINEKEVYD